MQSAGAAPRAVKHLLDAGLASWGQCKSALLPPLEGAWFLDATEAPDFERAPLFHGEPAETGALARHAHTPILQHLLAKHGNGLLTRWVARLVDMQFLAHQARVAAKKLRSAAAVQTSHRRQTRGAAVVETSRGALAHVVGVDGNRVTSWRVVAPTEWNFHPDGPMARGLVGAPAQDLHKRISLLAAGLDPCVAFEVFTHGDGNA
jgi:Ni,Fe-hydrogenase I large subunit